MGTNAGSAGIVIGSVDLIADTAHPCFSLAIRRAFSIPSRGNTRPPSESDCTPPDLDPPGHRRSLASSTPAELCLSDQKRSLPRQLDNHPVGVDELITRTSLTASQVLATLSVLELKRLVRRLPGHQFVRA